MGIKKFYLDNYFSESVSQKDKELWFETNEQAKRSVEIMQKLQEKSKHHKDKFTGIYDRNGVPINNGDDVLVHHYNTHPKTPYKCKVVYKHGWVLKGKEGYGNNYDVYAWRKAIEVVKSDNQSIFELKSYQEIKDKWFSKNVSFMIAGEQRKLLNRCFEEAFKLGQELKQEYYEAM